MKAKKKAAMRASSTIEVRLPKDTQAALEAVSKLAGVPLNNVVKLAVAEGVMRHRARVAAGQPVQAPSLLAQPAGPRYVNLDAKGKPTTGEHVAVYDRTTGLTWSAHPLQSGKAMNHAAAMKACADLDLMGHKDWRAPTIAELLAIVDYERYDPAIDTAHFKGPYGWTWTSTPFKGNSGAAWFVSLVNGYSDWSYHFNDGRVRAVRAGQSLDLGLNP